MLEQVAQYNDFSAKLREELETKMKSFGKRVRFKFNISNPNPDPEKYNGAIIWPFLWTLDPAIFSIVDPYEKRDSKSKSKQVAMVERQDEKGVPNKFERIRVHGRYQGIMTYDLTLIEDQKRVMYILLHPKLTGGRFSDVSKQQIISLIDEKQEATVAKAKRQERKLAMAAAGNMSEAEVKEFAAAMLWDENEEMEVLRNLVEEYAEASPSLFVDLVENKSIEFKALVKRAVDQQIIAYNPSEFKFVWVENQQTITMIGQGLDGKHEVDRLAEWLMTSGKQGDSVYLKLKSLSKV